jgi:hypothetical protein
MTATIVKNTHEQPRGILGANARIMVENLWVGSPTPEAGRSGRSEGRSTGPWIEIKGSNRTNTGRTTIATDALLRDAST